MRVHMAKLPVPHQEFYRYDTDDYDEEGDGLFDPNKPNHHFKEGRRLFVPLPQYWSSMAAELSRLMSEPGCTVKEMRGASDRHCSRKPTSWWEIYFADANERIKVTTQARARGIPGRALARAAARQELCRRLKVHGPWRKQDDFDEHEWVERKSAQRIYHKLQMLEAMDPNTEGEPSCTVVAMVENHGLTPAMARWVWKLAKGTPIQMCHENHLLMLERQERERLQSQRQASDAHVHTNT